MAGLPANMLCRLPASPPCSIALPSAGVCARRAVRVVQRPVLQLRGVGRALRQPRAVRAGAADACSACVLPGTVGPCRITGAGSNRGRESSRPLTPPTPAACLPCQACRLPYALLVDGIIRELGDSQYLLSPQVWVGASSQAGVEAGVAACLPALGALRARERSLATGAGWGRREGLSHGRACLPLALSFHAGPGSGGAGAGAGAGGRDQLQDRGWVGGVGHGCVPRLTMRALHTACRPAALASTRPHLALAPLPCRPPQGTRLCGGLHHGLSQGG